jgi:hypothetical protein
MFNFKKLNEVEFKEEYRAEVSKRFAALENLDTAVKLIGLEKRLERI